MSFKPLNYLVFLLFLISPTLSKAQSQNEWFADHLHVPPLKQVIINYNFPSPNHCLVCLQEASASQLASVEWQYAGQMYKSQLGDISRIRLVLTQDNSPTRWQVGSMQNKLFADHSGAIIVTNNNAKYDFVVSCMYTLDLD